jgi:hypothetical protein
VEHQIFYQTVAQLSFTLLGLWALILQTKYSEWIGSANHRRRIANISLYFLLPGSMSLLALLSVNAVAIWRVAFFAASALGAAETGLLISAFGGGPRSWVPQVSRWVGLFLYTLLALLAIAPEIAQALVGLEPLTVTGIVETLLVMLGLILAWEYFTEPAATDRREGATGKR